jgi:WD40 repeat protein
MQPLITLKEAHQGEVVEDVIWSHFSESEFASVGDDKCLRVWDLRTHETCVRKSDAQSDDLMCIDTSAFDPFLIVTGSNDSKVSVWDQRNLSAPLINL